MKTYNVSINFKTDEYTNQDTYMYFKKVKTEDVSEILRFMITYSDITNITISKDN